MDALLDNLEKKRAYRKFTPNEVDNSFYEGRTFPPGELCDEHEGIWVLHIPNTNLREVLINYPLVVSLKLDSSDNFYYSKVDGSGVNVIRLPIPEKLHHKFHRIIVDYSFERSFDLSVVKDLLVPGGQLLINNLSCTPGYLVGRDHKPIEQVSIARYCKGESDVISRTIDDIACARWTWNKGDKLPTAFSCTYSVYVILPDVSHDTIAIRGKAPEVKCLRQSTITSQSSKVPKLRTPDFVCTSDFTLIEIPETICTYTLVTYESFKEICTTETFSTQFHENLQKLYDVKLRTYGKCVKTLTSDFEMMKKTLEGMKVSPNNFSAIKEIFPNYVSLQTQIETINGIVNLVYQKRITSTPKFGKIVECIDTIVGRHAVKDFIARLLFAFSKDYRSILNTFGSLALLGNAGMGKTALMKVIGYALSKSGILVKKTFKIVSRKELVSQFLGGTAHHTRDLLMSSLEGVIGIDECHSLISDIKGDYGNESVSELVNFMDKFMGLTFVIISGYSLGMEKMFFDKNEGLARRFKNTFVLEKYTAEELTLILLRQLHHLGATIESYDANLIYSLITRSYETDCNAFPNQAGDMLNLASTIHTNILCNMSDTSMSQVLLSILT